MNAALALVLVSAFLHAVWNAMLRLERDKDRIIIAAIACASLIALGVAGLRWALGVQPFESSASFAWAVVAGVFEVGYFATLARALEAGPLGPVYTISRGGAMVLVWPISVVALGEEITVPAASGSLVVLCGVALASSALPGGSLRNSGATAWAIACAASIAGYHLAYDGALAAGGSPSAVFAVALVVATAINVARLGRAGRQIVATLVRERPLRILMMGAIVCGSFTLLLEALASTGAGFVLTLRNTSVLFATGLAWWIGDPPRNAQIAGALFVAAGAVMMAC